MWQLPNEPDRVGNERLKPLTQIHRTCRGIKRGEEAVLDEKVRIGKSAEQRRLPRVRISDERHSEFALP